MKKMIILLLILISGELYSQSLSIFDIDTNAFPIINAKFYALDAEGKQIINLSVSDFDLTENGVQKNVTFVSCPMPKPPMDLSAVLTIDISGSMESIRLEQAKVAASSFIEALPLGKSDCAITSFNSNNYMNQDFTTDKKKLLNAIDALQAGGSTDFDAGFINPMAGSLLAVEKGKNKKVVVFLTDGKANGNEQAIINKANEINAVIYCITLGMPCPNKLRNIAEKTGGQWFENVLTIEQAIEVYRTILMIAQDGNPCEIVWESDYDCDINIIVDLTLKINNSTANNRYIAPSSNLPLIKYSPSPSMQFGIINPPISQTKEITITAKNKAVNISSITITNSDYRISDWDGSELPFKLDENQSRTLKVEFTPSTSAYSFCRFEFESDACYGNSFFASGNVSDFEPDNNSTLKMTFPNGNETFIAGSDTSIIWEGVLPSDTVSLEYSVDNGMNWINITDYATDLKYNWKNIPNNTSKKCLMKVAIGEVLTQYPGGLMKMLGFGDINQIAHSPNRNILAVAHNNLVSLIDLDSNRIIRIFSGHTDVVNSIAFSPDGNKIISGSNDYNIKIWDVNTGELLNTLSGHTDGILTVAFSPDGSTIASGAYETIKLWDVNTGSELRTFFGHANGIFSIVFGPSGIKLASGGYDNSIKIWDVESGKLLKTIFGHSYSVNSVAISPDGMMVASGSWDGTIKLWNLNTGEEIRMFSGHTNGIFSLAFSPDGSKIVSGGFDSKIKLWDVNGGPAIKTLSKHSDRVNSVVFSPDGRKIISGSNDNSIIMWNAETGAELKTFFSHNTNVSSVAYSPDGSKVVSGDMNGSIKLWDIKTGMQIWSSWGHFRDVKSIAFSPDGSKIVSGGYDRTIKIFEVSTGTRLKTLSGHTSAVNSVAFSPNGSKIASGSFDNSIKIWDVNTGTELFTFSEQTGGINTIDFSPDGSLIVSGDWGGRIILWNAYTGKVRRTFTGYIKSVNSLAFSPDGAKIAAGIGDGTIKLLDASTGAELLSIVADDFSVYSVAYSPDGSKIASRSWDETFKLWNIKDGQMLKTFSGHSDVVSSIAFSPDGNKIVSGSWDNTIGIWAVEEQIKEGGQKDISDSIWSIVSPQAIAKDLDMGKVLVGSVKDSLIIAFITNSGTSDIRIDSIALSGTDAEQFQFLSGIPPYNIAPGDSKSVEFRFEPNSIGVKKADIIIYTQADTLIQTISGEGVELVIQISNDLIDFGRVYVGYEKDTTITAIIENVSSKEISFSNVENGGPDATQFSILNGDVAFTLVPGESKEMDLRFSAIEVGRTSGSLAFHYGDVGSPAIVQLFAEGYKIIPKITTNSPLCIGHELLLFADSIPNASYHWSGPNGFKSNEQNIIIKNADQSHSGEYILFAMIDEISTDTVSISIEIATFLVSPGDSSLIFTGNAERIEDYIRLTESKSWDAGSIWLKNRFSIKQDFSTTFQFKVRYGDNNGLNERSIQGGDGFAFVMQNHNYPFIGNKGEAMGYNGVTNSLAIEFDLFRNIYDPNGNHIAVQSMGAFPNSPVHSLNGPTLGLNEDILEIEQYSLYYVKIEYEWTTQTFKIYLDSSENLNEPVLIINDIDLATYLNLEDSEFVYLGFTSATGKSFQEHLIYNWIIPCNNQFVDVEDKYNPLDDISLIIYPNPFTSTSTISYILNKTEKVNITIRDIIGASEIILLDDEFRNVGQHSLEFDASELPAGIYFCTLRVGAYTKTVKMLVLE